MTGTGPRLPPGWRLAVHETLGSTNDEARRLLRQGAPAFTAVWARAQSGGRGRDGRSWTSPPGNLYVSIVLRPTGPPLVAAQLGFVSALAVAEAVDQFVHGATIKWPNDVLLNGSKIAGILLESEGVRADGIDGLVSGIGINVARHPADSRLPATSLHAAGACSASVEAVLEALASRFSHWHASWSRHGFVPVRAAWSARAHGLGTVIQVRLPRETLSGRFVEIDPRGALLLETQDGPRTVTAGDVFFPPTLC